MFKLLKFLIILTFLGFVGLVGFAYLGNLDPEQEDVRIPVNLND